MTTKRKTKAPPAPAAGDVAATFEELASLHEWKRNPRNITEQAVQKVAESIRVFGFGAPIIARHLKAPTAEGHTAEIIAGHTRSRAAKLLGQTLVPVRFMDHLTEAQAELLALADNRLGEEVDWVEETLAALFLEHDTELLQISGFDKLEIAEAQRATDELLSLDTPHIPPRDKDSETFRFRVCKIRMSVETADAFQATIDAYIERVGTTNGFLEFLVDAAAAADQSSSPRQAAAE